MQIRQLGAGDYDDRMALSQFAFQMRLTEEQLELRRKSYRPEEEWGAFDERGELLSALSILPLETWLQGRLLRMGGVAGVATWPEARRQGCVSKLLLHALTVMKREGQTVSMLHPFSFGFYRRYGYEMTIERKKYTIETRQLPPRKDTPGFVKRMAERDTAVLDAIYSAYASRYNGNILRTPSWWNERVFRKEGMFAVYYREDRTPEGYVFYEIANGLMTLHEMAYVSDTAYTALWTFVANHDSMISEVTWMAPVDDSLPFLLPDPRIRQEIVPYFMTRIVDAQAFVKEYAWEPDAENRENEETVLLRLTDEHAPWNEGEFRLVWSAAGEGRLERIEAGEAASRAADEDFISCDIQGLAAMLAGGRRPTWLAAVGRIAGPGERLRVLERRIPNRTAYLVDFF
ncbi:GNAT family N-acetyltransferase [Cohnella boryungensis]|uniref:Enhanced intracellular survival protein Eis n=1 Tax=Cohnella boryungensis TaxID=768479 RepID=A0ABV8S8W1_9BACL